MLVEMSRAYGMAGQGRWRVIQWFAALVALLFLGSGEARAQQSFADLGGTWWFELSGDDAGALLMAVKSPHQGSTEIEETVAGQPSFGFSRALGTFFLVASGQTLSFDSMGNVVGTLELTDPSSGVPIGTLTLEKGKPNKKFTSWKPQVSIDGGTSGTVLAKLKGERLPQTFPVLSGGSPETGLSGKGVKSKTFDLHVISDTVLGLPAYLFDGEGPVEIDGVETPATTLTGGFMLAPSFKLFGLLEDSSAFGTGDVTGKLELPGGSLVPKLKLVATADRKVTAKGKLTEPVDPVLSVSPTSLDFVALHIGDSQDKTFAVTNVGAGLLSGEASFLDGDGGDFSFTGDETYTDLAVGDPAYHVTVHFEAANPPGPKTEQILFDVGGGRVGAQIVTVTAESGIAEATVNPTSVAFGIVSVGDTVWNFVTLTNTGDGILVGSAAITGSPDFGLALIDSGNPLAKLDYDLDPGEQLRLFVRFLPTTTTPQIGTVTLSGGGGATVQLTGTGATP
jgi:hypothetical protein